MKYCQICGKQIKKFNEIEIPSMGIIIMCKRCDKIYNKEKNKVKKIEKYLLKAVAEMKKIQPKNKERIGIGEINEVLTKIQDDVLQNTIRMVRGWRREWKKGENE